MTTSKMTIFSNVISMKELSGQMTVIGKFKGIRAAAFRVEFVMINETAMGH